MGIFDKLKDALSGKKDQQEETKPDTHPKDTSSKKEFDDLLERSRVEFKNGSNYFYSIKINTISYYNDEVVKWDDDKKVNFIVHCCRIRTVYNNTRNTARSSSDLDYQICSLADAYSRHLLRTKIILTEDHVQQIYAAFIKDSPGDWMLMYNWPTSALLNLMEKQYGKKAISDSLKNTLEDLQGRLKKIAKESSYKDAAKLVAKIDGLLSHSGNSEQAIKPTLFLGDDPFSAEANKHIQELPENEKVQWYQLITLAQKASGSKPSQKYLDSTKVAFKELGPDKFKKIVLEWFEFVIGFKEHQKEHRSTWQGREHIYYSYEFISAINLDTLKGFVWICSHFHDSKTIHTIAALAERAYRKIPGKGPAAASLGNACLFVLYKSKGLDGIGQLSRLKLRIKQSSTQNAIEKYLSDAAKEQGVSISEIEDLAVDDFDLVDGKKEVAFDDYKAELRITGVGKSEIKWYKPDGSLQKSPPTFVKEKYAAKLKKLKDSAKFVDQTTSAQRDRIDRMLRLDRKMNWEHFQKFYFNHGLMSFLTRDIIWNFEQDNQTTSCISINNAWTKNTGETFTPNENVKISLWHPALNTIGEIEKWREFLVEKKIRQPLKQAFREVYLLTDAEVRTKTYSNRMAAHILKQHQFNSLAKTRGWKYSLLGAYDDGRDNEMASLNMSEYKIRAEYWVNEVNADNEFNDTGIWNYIATDQLRFVQTDTGKLLDLVDVPPLLFSEVLRDVDLFVGVASVGNDPTWRDSGGIVQYRDYWQSYSFGDLSELAKTRKGILINLVPRLKIAKVAEVKDKFLVVKGKLRTYKIHIGSTNILMEPNDQYLCIVADRSAKNHTQDVFLPFEGDSGLSIILSKAFLLADDDKITDTTITSQINRN